MKLKIVDIIVALGVDIRVAGKVESGGQDPRRQVLLYVVHRRHYRMNWLSPAGSNAASIAASTVYSGSVVPVFCRAFSSFWSSSSEALTGSDNLILNESSDCS